MNSCDLIIIGAGPGGYRTAEYAAKNGLKVVIFEGEHVGGTCLNVGCIPTKTYVHATSFEEAVERQPQVVELLRSGVETLLSHPNITLVREKGRFADEHTVEGCTSGDRFAAPNIIIATGSQTKWLPLPDLTDPHLVDSTGLLQLKQQPKRLAIIGAGVIGMEFASVFNRFGTEVTVIEYLKECLPTLDSDIAKRLRKTMEKMGVTFNMQCAVKAVEGGAVVFERKGKTETIDADVILMATGRKPRTEGLNLEATCITLAPNGSIPVDNDFRISTPLPSGGVGGGSLFAIGDVNGRQMLAHAAEMQGIHIVNQILGNQDNIRFGIMPAAIFTTPEAACVGKSEDQLKADGTPYECRKAFWRANGKALAMNETEGMLKLFSTPPSEGQGGGRILGCHAYGAHSADIVQEVSALMCLGATVEQLRDIVHIHPTLGEILLTAAEQ
ncbi:MAG: NAD(P)/FAD-dependent oxidoreductase [Prevotella sp.]|nr:NAD(P)/FAD-dependent oxidoreductase [Prevotella sp.]